MAEKLGDLGAELKRLRSEAGLTMQSLAESSGVTKAYIHQIERGFKSFKIGSDFGAKLSAALGVPLSHWATFTSDGHLVAEPIPKKPTTVRLPVLGTAAAGRPIDVTTQPDEWIEVPAIYPAGCFVVRIKGRSMEKYLIADGDWAIIRPADDEADVGQKCLWYIADLGHILKPLAKGKRWKDGNKLRDLEDGDRIAGVYVGLIRKE